MNILKSISKVIDTINEKVGMVCSYISAPLMLLIVFEVVSRKLGHPTIWGYETIIGVYGWLILMSAHTDFCTIPSLRWTSCPADGMRRHGISWL